MADPDRDEQVSARYRELGGGEPPARLDDAILAASRRAVHAGPGVRSTRRWAVPVSLAAAVILSVMVTLHVQEELPGLEVPPPAAPAETAKAVMQAPAATDAPAPERRAAPPSPAKPAIEARAKNERQDARPQAPPQFTPEPAPAPAPVLAQKAPDTAPAAVGELSARSAAGAGVASSPGPAAAAPAAAPMQMRERAAARDLSDAVAKRTEEARSDAEADTPEKQLERIAALRREGRHAEADKRLAEFRQRYPQYRIPEAMLEKVDPGR